GWPPASGGVREMLIIDSHAHIYSDDQKIYPAIAKPLRPPGQTGTLAHLDRERVAAGVRRVLAVQTTTFYGWDNRFLVDAARTHSAGWQASARSIQMTTTPRPCSSSMPKATTSAGCVATRQSMAGWITLESLGSGKPPSDSG